jgi:hypothetical protein
MGDAAPQGGYAKRREATPHEATEAWLDDRISILISDLISENANHTNTH